MVSRRKALFMGLGGTAAAGMLAASPAVAGAQPPQRPEPSPQWTPASGELYELHSGRHRALIGGVSASLLSWQVDGTELLLTHTPGEVGEGYQGKTILPWPNRIDAGQYSFGGRELQVPVNEAERNCALHGLVSFVEWQEIEHAENRLVLGYDLPPQYGYPFALRFRTEFTVDSTGIRNRLTATNIGAEPAPFGTANHTYLGAQPAGTTIDALRLQLPAETHYTTDDRLLPTGTASVEGTEYDFLAGRELGKTTLDTAFTGLRRDPDGWARVHFGWPSGTAVELAVCAAYPYLQVYTDDSPETERPARAGITVEPMTCAPNAFNTGDGLVTLAPGAQWAGTWVFSTQ